MQALATKVMTAISVTWDPLRPNDWGLSPRRPERGGKGRKGKAAPATGAEQANGGTVTAHCAPKVSSAATAQAMQEAHKAQDDAGAAYAASVGQQ